MDAEGMDAESSAELLDKYLCQSVIENLDLHARQGSRQSFCFF